MGCCQIRFCDTPSRFPRRRNTRFGPPRQPVVQSPLTPLGVEGLVRIAHEGTDGQTLRSLPIRVAAARARRDERPVDVADHLLDVERVEVVPRVRVLEALSIEVERPSTGRAVHAGVVDRLPIQRLDLESTRLDRLPDSAACSCLRHHRPPSAWCVVMASSCSLRASTRMRCWWMGHARRRARNHARRTRSSTTTRPRSSYEVGIPECFQRRIVRVERFTRFAACQ